MKIAITGAHRVGKTTLAEKLQESLPDFALRSEPYYELEEQGHAFSEIPTLEDYRIQLEYSIAQMSTSEDHIIFDRCPIDFLAYIQAINETEEVQSWYPEVFNAVNELDLLVFIPIEEPDLIDCPESELPELRYLVNEILNDWISDFAIPTIEVKGSVSERFKSVLNSIS